MMSNLSQVLFSKKSLLSQSQALRLDLLLVQKFGYEIATLMEVAGLGVATVVDKLLNGDRIHEVAIVVGSGNNGGDGWVAARYLHNWGYSVCVVMVDMSVPVTPQQAMFEKIGGLILALEDTDSESVMLAADCVVDAILGVGISGTLRPMQKLAVDIVNKSRGLVVSIDIPSGIHPDDGEGPVCVGSDHTVAMISPKKSLLVYPLLVGQLWVVNLGLPDDVFSLLGLENPWRGISGLVFNATFDF